MQVTEFRVRPARAGDAEGVAEVHMKAWQSTYRGLMPQTFLDGLTIGGRRERWEAHITGGELDVAVAVDGEGVIGGFIATGPCVDATNKAGDTGELWAIYLRQELQGQGIGTLLHRAGVDALSERFTEAVLWVLDGNARARAFYERHGWRFHGETRRERIHYFSVNEVRYRLSLPSAD